MDSVVCTIRSNNAKFAAPRRCITHVVQAKPSHRVLPPGHWRLKLKICRLFHANIMCKIDAEIKSYKDGKTIWIYHNRYLPCTYNSNRCRYVCNCYYYDRPVHISVAVGTLLDRKNFSSRTNGKVAARRVTGLIIKGLWYKLANHKVFTPEQISATIIKKR